MLLAAVTAAAIGLGLLAYATGLLYPLEAQSIHARFSIRAARPSLVKNFVIVQIDEETFNHLQINWPFPRRYHAVVIDHLLAAGAKLIAFDVQFTQRTDVADDDALIEAVDRAHNMVLATDAVDRTGQTGVLGGNAELRAVGARAGNSTVIGDSQGVIRDFQHPHQVDRHLPRHDRNGLGGSRGQPDTFWRLDVTSADPLSRPTGHRARHRLLAGV